MKKFFVLVVWLLAFSGNATACVYLWASPGAAGKEVQTKAYAGLAWTLGAKNSSIRPDLVVGVRTLTVKSSDQVTNGADLSGRFTFAGGFSLDSARLSYVGGIRDLLGVVGVGYSSTNKAVLTTLAAQGSHARVGFDYEWANRQAIPYLEVLSLNRPKKVLGRDGSTLCVPINTEGPAGYYNTNTVGDCLE